MSEVRPRLDLSPRDGYDLWAAIYDEEDNPLIRLETAEVIRALGELRGMEAADLGCGTGRGALAMTKAGARIVVSEMHPAMTPRGVTAHFRHPETGHDVRPASIANQISDFVMAAVRAGLAIENLMERNVDNNLAAVSPRAVKHLGWPLLFLMALRAPSSVTFVRLALLPGRPHLQR